MIVKRIWEWHLLIACWCHMYRMHELFTVLCYWVAYMSIVLVQTIKVGFGVVFCWLFDAGACVTTGFMSY